MDDGEARRRLENIIARRREKFVLSYLRSTENGYVLKFREGLVDIVRTRIDSAVLVDEDRLGSLLDEIRRDFRRLTARATTTPTNGRTAFSRFGFMIRTNSTSCSSVPI